MIGETIKDFTITAQLGRGGMGDVFAAEQRLIKTKVAIKMLQPQISAEKAHVDRFFNEAIAVSKIKHAGIVKIFDVGFHQGRAYLVMEFLDGEPLSSRVRRGLPFDATIAIARQVVSILDATHAAGIVHRDLKPDNIFLVPDTELGERVRVLDFGIAKLVDVQATTASMSMGTPAYMAPELWKDAATSGPATDVYAFGCVLFELCCGRPPFIVTTVSDACGRHLAEIPPRVRSLRPELPAALDDLIAAMLEKEPPARPSTKAITTAISAISALSNGGMQGPAPPAGPPSTTVGHAVSSAPGDAPAPPKPRPASSDTAPAKPSPATETTSPTGPEPAPSSKTKVVVAVGLVGALGAGILIATRGSSKDDTGSTTQPSGSQSGSQTQGLQSVHAKGSQADASSAAIGSAARAEASGLVLSYRVLSKSPAAADYHVVKPGEQLHTDDRLVFEVMTSEQAHVFLGQRPKGKALALLFPNAGIDITNPLPPNTWTRIPSGTRSFRLNDKDVGAETVFFVASRTPPPNLAAAIANEGKPGQKQHAVEEQLVAVAMEKRGDCAGRGREIVLDGEDDCKVKTRGLELEDDDEKQARRVRGMTNDEVVFVPFKFEHAKP